jgi:hypothetical protein
MGVASYGEGWAAASSGAGRVVARMSKVEVMSHASTSSRQSDRKF